MQDIFDAKILCKKCNLEMGKTAVERGGFRLRALQCPQCHDQIIHPSDLNNLEHYNNLRHKTYSVKLRVIGNSHAISIPKEIVDFINESQRMLHRQMEDTVKLCFEDFGRLSVRFVDDDEIVKIKEEDL